MNVTNLKSEIHLELLENVDDNKSILLGSCKIGVADLMKNFGVDKWFLLEINRNFSGEVHIISKFQL